MITVAVTHEVKDFPSWKKIFDSDKPRRDGAGVADKGIYASVDDPNKLLLIFEAESDKTIQGMFNDPELQQLMKEAGVMSVPEMWTLNKG